LTDKNLNTNELEYVLLNGSESWEIDYASGSAIEVSEVMRKDSMRTQADRIFWLDRRLSN